jgi:3-isopropylmalate/(R)-2-methylmalate dehydratase small subunit
MPLKNIITGRAWVLGDNVNTDDLHPPSFFSMDSEQMKAGIQAGIKNLSTVVGEEIDTQGLIIVAGDNFGCGSSRETSVRALIVSGVQGIIAKSFARIFYRSLVNLSLIPFVCDTIQATAQFGDTLNIFPLEQKIQVGNDKIFKTDPVDPHFQRIIENGGLIGYLCREMGIASKES